MRMATEGKIVCVEHRFDLEPGTPERHRAAASAGRLAIDDRALTMPVRDVRVLFILVAVVAPMICSPMGLALAPSHVAALGAAFAQCRAASDYLDRNLRT
jgi:hypothetical protein